MTRDDDPDPFVMWMRFDGEGVSDARVVYQPEGALLRCGGFASRKQRESFSVEVLRRDALGGTRWMPTDEPSQKAILLEAVKSLWAQLPRERRADPEGVIPNRATEGSDDS